MKQTAGDIQSCGNVCDAYSKMSLLAKVLKGPLWEGTFASFVSKFSQRRDDIEFALSIHIAGKVDGLHEKVDDLAQIVERKYALESPMRDVEYADFEICSGQI